MLKRYLVFAGSRYYPHGGFDDFVSDHETEKDAWFAARKAMLLLGKRENDIWAAILDGETREDVYRESRNIDGKRFTYDGSSAHVLLHFASRDNHKDVYGSKECGCFHCRAIFPSALVKEFVGVSRSALCPKCGIDAVLPNVQDGELLLKMCDFWFGTEITG